MSPQEVETKDGSAAAAATANNIDSHKRMDDDASMMDDIDDMDDMSFRIPLASSQRSGFPGFESPPRPSPLSSSLHVKDDMASVTSSIGYGVGDHGNDMASMASEYDHTDHDDDDDDDADEADDDGHGHDDQSQIEFFHPSDANHANHGSHDNHAKQRIDDINEVSAQFKSFRKNKNIKGNNGSNGRNDEEQEEEDYDDEDYDDDEDDGTSTASTPRQRSNSTDDEDGNTESTRNVSRVRIITFTVLFISILAVCFAMFTSSRQGEVDQFELQFLDHANAIVDSFSTHWYQAITSMDAFALSLDATDDPDNAWPTKFIPNFAARAASVRNIGRFTILTILPLVKNADRLRYEAFTTQNHLRWIPQGMQYEIETNQSDWKFGNILQDEDSNTRRGRRRRRLDQSPDNAAATTTTDGGQSTAVLPCDPTQLRVDASLGIVRRIYTVDMCGPVYEADDAHDFYMPMWQHSPVDFAFVNYNIYSDLEFGPAIQHAAKTNTMVVSKARFLNDEVNTALTTKSINAPSSTIYFPILHNGSELKGMISASIYWDAYMQVGDLPDTADGIRIVLTSGTPCNQAYTFEVQGPDVVYLAEGDLHDSDFNKYREQFRMSEQEASSILSFTNVKLSLDHCPYTINVYPSQKVLDRYYTNIPILYTVLVLSVLLLTTVVFVGYDWLVERRQRAVMDTAVKSQAIVSSLFPKNVRKRLMEDTQATTTNNKGSQSNTVHQSPLVTQKMRLKNFMASGGPALPLTPGVSQRRRVFGGGASTASGSTAAANAKSSAPIADLFPNTTVLFADIAGFTAWSSVREPSHVFKLLETVYGAFDAIADRRRVFKIETIGDCYVAVTGLPDPQKDHAVIMSKFAGEILFKMTDITSDLEVELGPDTTSLRIRVGLHSGPVTAGVLRGQKSRFQLFGDTVNTASRMESNGRPNYIQCSQETADLLIASRKGHWVKRREDIIQVKGKGEIQTFWVFPKGCARRSSGRSLATSDVSVSSDTMSMDDLSRADLPIPASGSASANKNSSNIGGNGVAEANRGSGSALVTGKNQVMGTGVAVRPYDRNFERLIDWNVDLLAQLLKRIVARRKILEEQNKARAPMISLGSALRTPAGADGDAGAGGGALRKGLRKGRKSDFDVSNHGGGAADSAHESISMRANPRSEYAESIRLPQFDKAAMPVNKLASNEEALPEPVMTQLRAYVVRIAGAYQNDNPFHNFSHASHVTMSANKILNRVVSADDFVTESTSFNRVAAKLHTYSYGITSDPLTHFACVFSALIHDVDHPGVSNNQLIKEMSDMAQAYGNKSVAEQNSVDLAWGLLMDTAFGDLRRCLFADEADRKRFRQLLVNSVMATDIFDPELKAMRNKRWEKAFNDGSSSTRDGSSKSLALSSDENSIASVDISVHSSHRRRIRVDSSSVGSGSGGRGSRGGGRAALSRKNSMPRLHEDLPNLRATIVIEHIIQAADVAHTMQHWHVYQKWNQRLFHEMYVAHKQGRMDQDPSVGWYKGELWFYDNYIIPLAKKLSDCGVFGVSSDEFLNYAKMNRSEWERKGKDIVEEMKKEIGEKELLRQM